MWPKAVAARMRELASVETHPELAVVIHAHHPRDPMLKQEDDKPKRMFSTSPSNRNRETLNENAHMDSTQ